ncbi:MAG: DUF1573 domain-containing protein [Mangrovibacterium sp.]
MKIILFLSILLAGLTACMHSKDKKDADPRRNSETAQLVIREEFHNFGELQAGEIVSCSFLLKNAGSTPLSILEAESDCGCITVDFPRQDIAPGDSAWVDVYFNSSGETGKVLREISLKTNGGKVPKKLMVAATVNNEWINIYQGTKKDNN